VVTDELIKGHLETRDGEPVDLPDDLVSKLLNEIRRHRQVAPGTGDLAEHETPADQPALPPRERDSAAPAAPCDWSFERAIKERRENEGDFAPEAGGLLLRSISPGLVGPPPPLPKGGAKQTRPNIFQLRPSFEDCCDLRVSRIREIVP
jgi:hypothetical protein